MDLVTLLLLLLPSVIFGESQLYNSRATSRNHTSLAVRTEFLPSVAINVHDQSPLVNRDILVLSFDVRNISSVLVDEHRLCTSVWRCSLANNSCVDDDHYTLVVASPELMQTYRSENKVDVQSNPIEFFNEWNCQYRVRVVMEIQPGFNCSRQPARSSAIRQFMDEVTLGQGTAEATTIDWWWNKEGAASMESLTGRLYYKAMNLALTRALQNESRLTKAELDLYGLSGGKSRHFYNNIASLLPEVRYLEIGIFSGSTMISFLAGNSDKVKSVIGIDRWGEDQEGWIQYTPFPSLNAARDSFMSLLPQYTNNNQYVHVIQDSCWSVSSLKLLSLMGEQRFNVYMFDGPHNVDDHFFALTNFLPVLADTFIWVVDDWNWANVRIGTEAALEALRDSVVVLGKLEVLTREESSDWHNGIAAFVIQKRSDARATETIRFNGLAG